MAQLREPWVGEATELFETMETTAFVENLRDCQEWYEAQGWKLVSAVPDGESELDDCFRVVFERPRDMRKRFMRRGSGDWRY